MFLNVKNTQEIYDSMDDISRNNALNCVVVTMWVDEFNMKIFNTKDNSRLNSLNELLSWNRLMLNMNYKCRCEKWFQVYSRGIGHS